MSGKHEDSDANDYLFKGKGLWLPVLFCFWGAVFHAEQFDSGANWGFCRWKVKPVVQVHKKRIQFRGLISLFALLRVSLADLQ